MANEHETADVRVFSPRSPAAQAARALVLVTLLAGALPALPQAGSGLRAPANVTAGGTVLVESGTSDPTIEVTNAATGTTQSFPVDPSHRTPIPVAAVPGSILIVSVGRGRRARAVLIEVIAP